MDGPNHQRLDPRCIALAKQCYHGTAHGSKLLTCIEFRPGKTQADLWEVINHWEVRTSAKDPGFDDAMKEAGAMLAEVVVFATEVEMTPLDKVVDLARTKGFCVEGDGPVSEKVLAELERFLRGKRGRETFAEEGIDRVLAAFPLEVSRGLALYLVASLYPVEWEQWLERTGTTDDAGEMQPTGPRPRRGRAPHARQRLRHRRTASSTRNPTSPATIAFIKYMNDDGGRGFLAEHGIDALIAKHKAAGGTIGPEYAKKIVLDFFRAEHEKGKAANPREPSPYKRGSAAAFRKFVDTQGGRATLATRGLDTALEKFKAAGGDIVRAYAKKLVMQFYESEFRAGEAARSGK